MAQTPPARAHEENEDAEQSEAFIGRSGFLANRQSAAGTIPITPTRSYFADVLRTFLFPSSPQNLVSFLIIAAVLILFGTLSSYGRFFLRGWFLSLGLQGWYAAFRFEVVRTAASGEEYLPSIGFSDYWDEIIKPAIYWAGSWIVVFLPAFCYLVYAAGNGRITSAEIPDPGSILTSAFTSSNFHVKILGVLCLLGACAWPMVVLSVALQGFDTLLRPDLIVLTIARTLPGYVATLVLMYGTIAIQELLETISGSTVFGRIAGKSAGQALAGTIVFDCVIGAFDIYIEIVLMRLIGLYYHHFKKGFAWDWE